MVQIKLAVECQCEQHVRKFSEGVRFYIGWKKVGLRWPYEAGIIYHIYTWSFWIISLCILL